MRIGIDARFYGGEQSKGLGRYTQKLIQHLAQLDSRHQYVIFLQKEAYATWQAPASNFTAVLAPYGWYTLAEQIFMPLIILRHRVDLMHFPHFNVPLIYRKPFVVTIHDLIINHFPTERATTLGPLMYKFKRWAGAAVMRHAIKRAWKIITVSEYSKSDIMECYDVPSKKIVVTYEAAEPLTPVATTSLSNEDVNSAEKILLKYHITKPYLLYVGNAYPHKNLETLLDVWQQIKKSSPRPLTSLHYSPDFVIPYLVLVGQKDYFYARLQQTAWGKNIDEYIIFAGFVPDSELSILYRQAMAYIFPSLYEGFGLPPLEAMTQNLPVLAARRSCLPEILGDAAYYFDSGDISGIINAVTQIFASQSLREQLIQKGQKQVERYSWLRMSQKTLALYEQFFQQPN